MPRFQLSPTQLGLFCTMFVAPLLLTSSIAPCLVGADQPPKTAASSSESAADACFCKIDSGVLEDCPCTTDAVKSFNYDLHPKVIEVLGHNYFRYFQVNFNKPCKFWANGDGQCGNKNCAIKPCPVQEVPPQVLNHKDEVKIESKTRKTNEKKSSEGLYDYFHTWIHNLAPMVEPVLESLRTFVSDYTPESFWRDDTKEVDTVCEGDPLPDYSRVDTALPKDSSTAYMLNEFCTLDPLEMAGSDSCDYIDLLANEEKYTGYKGKSANRIWEKIYSDLCFKLKDGNDDEQCLEEKTFFRIVSGLHTSISIHLCSNYLLQEEQPMLGRPAVWGPNKQEFHRRFEPALTQNQGPNWLMNVYYLYLVELRAIAKAGDQLASLKFGDDAETRAAVGKIVAAAQSFQHNFNESQLFAGDRAKSELIGQFKEKFREISYMMDCMGCERCKVWGKLQVTGIGTALKILFTPSTELRLTRHEVVALLNGFGRVSTSIKQLDNFRTK